MRYLLLCLVFLFSGVLNAQNTKPFEGEINFKLEIQGGGEEMELAKQFMPTGFMYVLKGDNILIKTLGANSAMVSGNAVYNAKTNTAFLVQDAAKIVYQLNKVEASSEKAEDIKLQPNVAAGSESKKIAGYNCKHYIISNPEDETGQTDIWVTEEIKVTMPQALAGNMPIDQKIMAVVKGFPLALKMEGPGGLKIAMQAESVVKKAVSMSVFEMPKGYEVKPMDANMGLPGGSR